MVGLYDGLYLAGNCRESEFSVWDGEAGLVGVGEMGADVGGGGEGGRGGEGRGKWDGHVEGSYWFGGSGRGW